MYGTRNEYDMRKKELRHTQGSMLLLLLLAGSPEVKETDNAVDDARKATIHTIHNSNR